MSSRKSTRTAHGSGTIRLRTDGRWEARYTAGISPTTGKQLQKSIYGESQKEVLKKLRSIQLDLEAGIVKEPSNFSVKSWLDTWVSEYTQDVKLSTRTCYEDAASAWISPVLGSVKLSNLRPHMVQTFYNNCIQSGLSPRTVRVIHTVLHSALDRAVKLCYIRTNPSVECILPRITKREVRVIQDNKVSEFLAAIRSDIFYHLFYVDLFTGMRLSEILGLAWDRVDFKTGSILIDKQLCKDRRKGGKYFLSTTKCSKSRRIKPAPQVMDMLRTRYIQQSKDKLKIGDSWYNPWNLVFTDEFGNHLVHCTVTYHFKAIVGSLGEQDITFHSLRHSYAVLSIINGTDIKTLQYNLGHHTAAFTLDTYAHVTDSLLNDSANKMEKFIVKIGDLP